MGDDGAYFGYTTSGNDRLMEAWRMAARMGEDIRYYPPVDSGQYIEPTVNWDDPHFNNQDAENAAYKNDTIERIYKRIMAQDAGVVYQLGEQWYKVVLVIDDLIGRVLKAANGLKHGGDGSPGNRDGWTGAGADSFLRRGPGATLKSLDDWRNAAVKNWIGTWSLSYAITRHKSKMDELWKQYEGAMVQASHDWWERHGNAYYFQDRPQTLDTLENGPTHEKESYVDYLRTMSNMWNERAQKIQWEMAREYWQIMGEELAGGRGEVYEGPSDAVRENPKFIAQYRAAQFGVPNITVPNVTAPRVTAPNISTPSISAQNLSAQNLSVQNLSVQNLSVQNLSVQNLSVQNLSVQNLSAQNL
ncbi:hypothetical protein, partial [Protofrankia symbiont of Coriaria ruscifolia]|uniref:hypothetical protein n=1 Tax=Protofrankia symbiont of Coriaria ruscifolia TaxID=1306542 RepID=UPI001A940DB1